MSQEDHLNSILLKLRYEQPCLSLVACQCLALFCHRKSSTLLHRANTGGVNEPYYLEQLKTWMLSVKYCLCMFYLFILVSNFLSLWNLPHATLDNPRRACKFSHLGIILFIFICHPKLASNHLESSPLKVQQDVYKHDFVAGRSCADWKEIMCPYLHIRIGLLSCFFFFLTGHHWDDYQAFSIIPKAYHPLIPQSWQVCIFLPQSSFPLSILPCSVAALFCQLLQSPKSNFSLCI